MNKLLLSLILGILIVGTIIAGTITTAYLDLTAEQEDTLDKTNLIKSYDIRVSDIVCDKEKCISSVYQEGLINTQWIYFINGKVPKMADLISMRDAWVKERISNYADVQKERLDKGVIVK